MTEVILGTILLVAITLALTLIVITARGALMPSKPAKVTVNGSHEIAATTGSKLLQVLTGDGIVIPSACAGAGTCGLCRVRLDGGGAALPTEAAKLSPAELAAGCRLACQVTLRGDLAVEVDAALLGAEIHQCKVASARYLTPLIREIVLQLPEGVRPGLEAGAFVQVTAPAFSLDFTTLDVPQMHAAVWQKLRHFKVATDAPVTRAYSVSNRPEDTEAGRLVLNIRLALPPPSVADAPPGVVSSWLFGLMEGDTVDVGGPFGAFRAQETQAEMVFIGGGVGMAPLRAIIFDQLEQQKTKRKISYWYGARSKAEVFYSDEFADLAARHANFSWTVALSDPAPQDNWTGATGFVHQAVLDTMLADHPAPEACEYYLCGPPMMIRAVKAMLDDLGVDPDHIFADDFGV